MKFTTLTIFKCIQFSGIKQSHVIVQTSLPSISRKVSSSQLKFIPGRQQVIPPSPYPLTLTILLSVFMKEKVKVQATQSCLTLCNPWTIQSIEFSRPEYWSGEDVEEEALPFSRGSSQPRDQTQVSHVAGGFCTS